MGSEFTTATMQISGYFDWALRVNAQGHARAREIKANPMVVTLVDT
jgi:hypothetical protein